MFKTNWCLFIAKQCLILVNVVRFSAWPPAVRFDVWGVECGLPHIHIGHPARYSVRFPDAARAKSRTLKYHPSRLSTCPPHSQMTASGFKEAVTQKSSTKRLAYASNNIDKQQILHKNWTPDPAVLLGVSDALNPQVCDKIEYWTLEFDQLTRYNNPRIYVFWVFTIYYVRLTCLKLGIFPRKQSMPAR